MKRTKIFIFCMILILRWGHGTSLEEAVEKGIRINSEIQNNALESKILETDYRIRKLAKRFTLTGGANWLYRSEKTEIEMPEIQLAPGMSISDITISGGVYHSVDLKLSLIQPIFTGFALSGRVRLNEVQQALNLDARNLLERMLRGRIKSVFFNHRMLASQRNSLLALEKRLRNHLKKLEDLYREDLVGRSQLLETRLKHREILLALEEAADGMNRIASSFTLLTGMQIGEIDPGYREESLPRDTATKRFIRNHPDLKILSGKEEMIRITKKMSRGKNLPVVGGFAELHYGVPGVNFIGDQWMTYFQGGIEVKLNVFNWGKSRNENRINNYNLEKIANKKHDLIRRTELRLDELYSTLKSLERRSGTYAEMVRIAEEESKMKQTLFNEKQISNRDYVDSILNVENLRSLKEKTDLQSELVKVEINTLAGNKEEK